MNSITDLLDLEDANISINSIDIEVFFATPKYLKLQNTFPKVAAGNSSFLHVSPAWFLRRRNVVADILLFLVTDM